MVFEKPFRLSLQTLVLGEKTAYTFSMSHSDSDRHPGGHLPSSPQPVLQPFESEGQDDAAEHAVFDAVLPAVVRPNPLKNFFTIALVLVVFVGVFGGMIWLGSRAINRGGTSRTPSPTPSAAPTAAREGERKPLVAIPTVAPLPLATPFPTSTPAPTPAPAETPKPTATPSASLVDLSVEALTIEDPQTGSVLTADTLTDGKRIRVRAVLKNIGKQDSAFFRSFWTVNGETMGVNSRGRVPAGKTAVYDDVNSLVSPEFFVKAGSNTITYTVDQENVSKETATANNQKTLTFTSGGTKNDLQVEGLTLYELNSTTLMSTPSAGRAMTVKVQVKNGGSDKISGFAVRLQQNTSIVAETVYGSWIAAGQTAEVLSYNFTPTAGNTVFKISVNPENIIAETSTANNTKDVTVTAQ